MDITVPSFEVEVANGSSLAEIRRALQGHDRLEYVAMKDCRIYIHHCYFHGQIMTSQAVAWEDLMLAGRIYPEVENKVVSIDHKGIISVPDHHRVPRTLTSFERIGDELDAAAWQQQSKIDYAYYRQIFISIAQFLKTIDGDYRPWTFGSFIELPDYG